jgi:hypothetical protein
MKGEQITLMGTTNGTDATGTLAFRADVIHGVATSIRIPKGLALKIWSKHINGANVTLTTQYTTDIGVENPVWTDFAKDVFVATVEGDRNIEKRRPLLFRGLSGKEAVQFAYAQSAAGVSGVEINVEFCEIQ